VHCLPPEAVLKQFNLDEKLRLKAEGEVNVQISYAKDMMKHLEAVSEGLLDEEYDRAEENIEAFLMSAKRVGMTHPSQYE